MEFTEEYIKQVIKEEIQIVLDEKTQQISATKIREQMRKDGKLK